jgi:hypothetical protein
MKCGCGMNLMLCIVLLWNSCLGKLLIFFPNLELSTCTSLNPCMHVFFRTSNFGKWLFYLELYLVLKSHIKLLERFWSILEPRKSVLGSDGIMSSQWGIDIGFTTDSVDQWPFSAQRDLFPFELAYIGDKQTQVAWSVLAFILLQTGRQVIGISCLMPCIT